MTKFTLTPSLTRSRLVAVLALSSPLAAPLSYALTVNIPVTAPSNASTVTGSLFSLSIEQDRWLDWAQASNSSSRNEFFFNTLDNLIQITGEGPQIRIGADSEDHTDFNENIEGTELVFPDPTTTVPYPEATTIVVGDEYYEAVRFLPSGTHVIWGVNFGTDNLTAAVLEAQAIKRAFDSDAVKDAGVVLDFVEIGNEADLYGGNGHREKGFNISEYVQQWTDFAQNVSVAAGINSTSDVKFWGGAFAESSHSGSGFSPQGMFSNGILNSSEGKLIGTVSQHHYSGSFRPGDSGLLQDLMTKSTIRSNLTMFLPDISAVRSQGLDYVLGETNSYAGHGAPGVSNVAGAALWVLDYALFAKSGLGAARVFFHEGVGYKYNLIQPITLTRSTINASDLPEPLPPHVQPPYYAAIIAAEAIGNTGDAQVVELNVDNERVAGYGFFVGGTIVRAVFINSEAFLSTEEGERGSVHVDLEFGGESGPTSMDIKRLTIGHADDVSGLKWGGVSFETEDARPSGEQMVETVDVSSGFDIVDTEVVLLSFQ
ncbi:glycoside hydrolase family 79 protein [Dendrothele bispora CBS 962.96]|uniref:Glycoside hydrolase family 79 protein n=1 Tax=Dendrothele bispora (strain CBS 962.96) TaxID=1314807 RepID=A0A4S8MUV1_DENBC|nr:glycoside hydrolase family 79 protein [Dendrothele bispora CBS 962.96]